MYAIHFEHWFVALESGNIEKDGIIMILNFAISFSFPVDS